MKHPGSCQMLGYFAVLLVASLQYAASRDLRQVSEPKIPASCESLRGNDRDETSVLQKALNSCAKGRVVHLASGTFVSGHLTIPSGVGLWIDSGVVLKASNNPKLYDTGKNLCGTLNKVYHGCSPFIRMVNTVGSMIYGKGTIDGQGGVNLVGKNQSWWDLAHEAKLKNEHQNNPILIEIDNSRDIILYQVSIKNGPNYHVVVSLTDGFTAISTGYDNVAIKASNGPSKQISVMHNRFGPGHGMSIGSDLTVVNLTHQDAVTGLHIKSDRSRGSLVPNITYTDVCMRNITNPIDLQSEYNPTATGNFIPEYKGISYNNIKVLTPAIFTFDGYRDEKPIGATLHNVHIAKGHTWVTRHAKISGKYFEDASGSSC
ncbi:hypothetical protein PR048_010860 [Dryococelus australis]|uniref:Glycoside hydrolase family 28 n=1 Tax=Dryococelus australis TaxID=614101 RepID=A0ABQ9I3W4_9NEOP|nr:hypothetical protein PR048_010860 [Dryococelus australis]